MSKLDDIFKYLDPYEGSDAKQQIKDLILELIGEATAGESYTMPIKSMRTRNTAFKVYANKHFNNRMKQRRERLRQKVEEL